MEVSKMRKVLFADQTFQNKKEYLHIPIPYIIRAYNKGMGGVDRCDQLLSFYR